MHSLAQKFIVTGTALTEIHLHLQADYSEDCNNICITVKLPIAETI